MDEMPHRRVAVQAARPGQLLWLERDQARHLTRVLRMAAGERVIVFTPDGTQYEARIAAVERDRCALEVAEPAPGAPDTGIQVRVTVAFSPPKPQRCDWLVEKATEMGAVALMPVVCRRTQAEREGLADARAERWRRIAREAAEQSARGSVPAVLPSCPLPDLLARAPQPDELRLVAHLGPEARPVLSVLASKVRPGGTVWILIGPEGGLTDEELSHARAAAYLPVSLGPTILRTETAVVAALAAVVLRHAAP